MREYSWQLKVRSYESDAWGYLPTCGILRYLEQSAVAAADDAGYGNEFHRRNNSAWVIRRMTLLVPTPVRPGESLDISTWISSFARVRGGREYRMRGASGQPVATALAEWVYINRTTSAPMAIPPEVDADFDPPGAPVGTYEPPTIEAADDVQAPIEHTVRRTVEWHECDSMGHVNNANYANWLDDAMLATIEASGTGIDEQRESGLRLHGEYYKLDYRRAARPGDQLDVTTRVDRRSATAYAVAQRITTPQGDSLLTAGSVYRWREVKREP